MKHVQGRDLSLRGQRCSVPSGLQRVLFQTYIPGAEKTRGRGEGHRSDISRIKFELDWFTRIYIPASRAAIVECKGTRPPPSLLVGARHNSGGGGSRDHTESTTTYKPVAGTELDHHLCAPRDKNNCSCTAEAASISRQSEIDARNFQNLTAAVLLCR